MVSLPKRPVKKNDKEGLKKVLIISPHFPPVNAPDMQRVRMSLPYYKSFGWEPVVLGVKAKYVDGYTDDLLAATIPGDTEIHKLDAWPLNISRKFGIGSISIRSLWYFLKKGNALLSQTKFDLVFFSTSNFHVCALGPYWKKKYGIPFVIDMQDPWRNDFLLQMPPKMRHPKFRIDYMLNKKLEGYTMPKVAGLMSVSQAYIETLQQRYPELESRPIVVIPFGVSNKDFELVRSKNLKPGIIINKGKINVVYAGAINPFFLPLVKAFFIAFKESIPNQDDYHFYFIGTNYTRSTHKKTVAALARELGIEKLVTEMPDRISYFTTIATLSQADIIFIPGLINASYNPSKIFTHILTGKPIFSVFNEKSMLKDVMEKSGAGIFVGVHQDDTVAVMVNRIKNFMGAFAQLHQYDRPLNNIYLEQFLAPALTKKQADFFDRVIAPGTVRHHLTESEPQINGN